MKEIKLYIYKFPESWSEKMMSKKEKAIREYLQTLTKDRVIELCLQYIYDKNVVETQLEEKDKVISKLQTSQRDKTQLAIQELEKVEELILKIDNNHREIKTLKNGYSTLYIDSPTVMFIIDQQIKELSGGKDGKF